jgi:hypothetical protein
MQYFCVSRALAGGGGEGVWTLRGCQPFGVFGTVQYILPGLYSTIEPNTNGGRENSPRITHSISSCQEAPYHFANTRYHQTMIHEGKTQPATDRSRTIL